MHPSILGYEHGMGKPREMGSGANHVDPRKRVVHLKALHRPCNVESVYGADNDGGRGEEEEEDEEAGVEQDKSHPPRYAVDR